MPDDPAQGGRLADGAARVRADRQRGVVGRHGRRRAAAAAARDAIERPRIGRRAVGGVLGRRAHRELVHVGLAEDDRAGVAQALGDVGVVRRAIALEDPRAGRALAALDRHEVLERDRDAEQRRAARRGRPLPSPRAAAIRASAASASPSARSRSMDSQALSAVVAGARRRPGAPRSARATRPRRRAAARPSRGRGGASGRSSAAALSARRGWPGRR